MDPTLNQSALGAPYFLYWGKARPAHGPGPGFHLLPYHCLDVAAVAVEYLRRHPTLRSHFKHLLRIEDDEMLLGWIGFWVALHDLGKFSEAFQSQRADLVQQLKARPPIADKIYTVRHDSLGMLLWRGVLGRALEQELGFGDDLDVLDGIDAWVRAVTGHHGQPPLETGKAWTFFFDRNGDVEAALQFVRAMQQMFLHEAAARIPRLQDGNSFRLASVELSWWMAGLTVLADWIGSNADVFAYCADPAPALDQYWRLACTRACDALDASGVLPIPAHTPHSFQSLFPAIQTPSPLQAWAASTQLPEGPQIHILEDVTGAGKTEAAVMLVHRLLGAGVADGFFIGLPTMATANAMYGRIANVYALLFTGHPSLVLAHAKDRLVEKFADSVVRSGREEGDRSQQDDTATARCAAWLADHRKRALLSPAGVGTIDQALLGALQSRHQSLRLLGIFRKVLVVDEVHACDAYMQGVLEALLRLHAQAGGSAVLLSATLPTAMKQSLLAAFAQGRGSARVPPSQSTLFPLATSWSSASADRLAEHEVPTRPDVRRNLTFRYESDLARIFTTIEEALAAGRCVAWIRNTVADVLDAWQLLASRVPPDQLTIFHARFTLGDRLATENEVLRRLGPESTPAERGGQLLLATQVFEMSLDADVDVLITDLAPIDRLLQRAGRLRRHVRDANGQRLTEPGARDGRGTPVVWVYGPAWTPQPTASWFKDTLPKAARVYPYHWQLWLTARLLQGDDRSVTIPEDARALVETVFGSEEDVPQGLQGNANAAEGKKYGDISLARENCVKVVHGYARQGTDWLEDARTPSRLGEDTVEVLLARWDGDALLPWSPHAELRHAWAYSAVRVAARQIADVPEPESPQRRLALQAAKESLPAGGKWCVVLPLEQVNGQWQGMALAAPANGEQTGKRRTWRYDRRFGLVGGTHPIVN